MLAYLAAMDLSSSFMFAMADCPARCTSAAQNLFLGVPVNIASYALLTHMVAQVCDLEVGDLVWTGGDCHIYDNHRGQVVHQILRTPRKLPTLLLNRGVKNINEFTFDDVTLVNYLHHPAIKGEVAV